MKIMLGEINAKIRKEEKFRTTTGIFSKHYETNEKGQFLVDCASEQIWL